MIERLLVVLIVAAIAAVAWRLAALHLDARRRALLGAEAPTLAAGAAPSAGRSRPPTLVYLYTAQCGQCRQQARAIADLEARLGGRLTVRRVDALAESDVAGRFGVWTVPSTVVLDAAGRSRAINYGLASAEQLEAQLVAAS